MKPLPKAAVVPVAAAGEQQRLVAGNGVKVVNAAVGSRQTLREIGASKQGVQRPQRIQIEHIVISDNILCRQL